MGIESVLRARYDWITQNSFRAPTSQDRKGDTDSREMAKACQAKITREKLQTG